MSRNSFLDTSSILPVQHQPGISALIRNLRKDPPTTKKKCIRFSLKLNSGKSFNFSGYKRLNWLPVSNMVNQCISSQVVESFQNGGPSYMSAVFIPNEQSLIFKNLIKVSPWRYGRYFLLSWIFVYLC